MSFPTRITLLMLLLYPLPQPRGTGAAEQDTPPRDAARSGQQDSQSAREELRSGTGAAPGSVLPAKAIDTTEIPKIDIAAAAPPDEPLPWYRIGEHTYFLFGNIATVDERNRGWTGNAGFIVGGEGVIVIDTLGTPKLGRRLIATIRRVTAQPIRYVIITHNHPDHAYGAAAFQALEDATIIAHEGTIEYTHSDVMQRSTEYRRQLLGHDMDGYEPVEADIYVKPPRFGRYRIALGDEIIDVYNAGSHHSYGDLVVHQVNDDVVWVSDLAFNQRTTFLGDGDSRQILEGQDWLMDRFGDAKLMVPGHGSAQSPPFPMVQRTHRYVERLRETMREAVESGVTLMEAVDQADFSDWRDTRLYESNQRANANFVYREMEQQFFAQ
jgi:glyoxylase-like metal-dependent hydrolase (beta-lactamase superfamily II)